MTVGGEEQQGAGQSASRAPDREGRILQRRLQGTQPSGFRPSQAHDTTVGGEKPDRPDAIALLRKQLQTTLLALEAASKRSDLAETRAAELEGELAELARSTKWQAPNDEIVRLVADVQMLREAKRNSEVIALDARMARKNVETSLEELQRSAAFRLGSILMKCFSTRWGFLQLPRALADWHRNTLPASADNAFGSERASLEASAVERAIAQADRFGIEAAESWVQNQRYPAPLLARSLLELGKHVRKRQPAVSVRLARQAADADPNETRIKHLAFMLMDSGSIGEADQILRSAIAAGASLNPTEQHRAEELAAWSRWQARSLELPPRKADTRLPAERRLLVYTAQSLPFHWSAVSMRAHAAAQAATLAGWSAEIVTPPGYPPKKAEAHVEAVEVIEGITYRRLDGVEAEPGIVDAFTQQAGSALGRVARSVGFSAIMASSEVQTGYVAAIAGRITGIPLILDHNRRVPDAACDQDRLLDRLQTELLQQADAILARSAAMADHAQGLATQVGAVALTPDAAPMFKPHKAAARWRNDPAIAGRTVLGYVGDPYEDIDLETLPDLLGELVADKLDVALLIFGVGSRFRNLQNRALELGLGDRILVAGRPRVGAIAEAYAAIDICVIPDRRSGIYAGRRVRFEINEALAHGRCIVTGLSIDAENVTPHLLRCSDATEMKTVVAELVRDASRRELLAERAAEHARRHISLEGMAASFRALGNLDSSVRS